MRYAFRYQNHVLIFGILLIVTLTVQADKESWYTYWALGLSNHDHHAAMETFIRDAQSMTASFDRSEVAADTFGFYWPVANTTLLGFVFSGSSDVVTELETDEPDSIAELFTRFPYINGVSEYLTVRQTLYAASAMHFYGDEPGDGFFLRGDAGIARLEIETDFVKSLSNETGMGLLIGSGYGIPLSRKSRLLISITYSYNQIGGNSYSATALRIGGLW